MLAMPLGRFALACDFSESRLGGSTAIQTAYYWVKILTCLQGFRVRRIMARLRHTSLTRERSETLVARNRLMKAQAYASWARQNQGSASHFACASGLCDFRLE